MNRCLHSALVVLMAVQMTACQSAAIRPALGVATSNFFARDSGGHVTIKGRSPMISLPVRRLVMASGSGAAGFESVSISSDGRIEVVNRVKGREVGYERFAARIPVDVATAFLASPTCTNARRLLNSYSLDDMADGGQAFLRLDNSSASGFTWMNNCYPDEFVNLWWRGRELVSSINTGWVRVAKNLDGQEEYYHAAGLKRRIPST